MNNDDFCVLMYHEIIKREDFNPNCNSKIQVNQEYEDILPKPLFVFLDEFEKQMKYLYDGGYTTLRLQDVADFYYNKKPLPEKAVLLTFDDLYKSILKYVYPILKKYKFSAVGFVVLDWLFNEPVPYSSTKSVCLSKGELETMRDVFEYANHTCSLHRRNAGKTDLEITNKDKFIADTRTCEQFVDIRYAYAYPFGVYTEEVMSWLEEIDYKLAFTTEGGRNLISTNPLKLHRNGVFINSDLNKFKRIVDKQYIDTQI